MTMRSNDQTAMLGTQGERRGRTMELGDTISWEEADHMGEVAMDGVRSGLRRRGLGLRQDADSWVVCAYEAR